MKYFTFLFLVSGFAACTPSKPLTITYAPLDGTSIQMRQQVTSEVSMTIMDEEQEQSSENTSDYSYKIISRKPDGSVGMEVRVTRMQISESNVQGVASSYDSADPNMDTSNVKIRMFKHLIGAPNYMTLSPDGKVLEYKGLSGIMDKMFAELGEEASPVVEGMKKSFNDTTMMESMSSMWYFVPTKPVKVGKKWKRSFIQRGQMSMKHDVTYKLISRNEREAIIESKSIITPPPGGGSELDLKIMKIKYDLSGTADGTSIVSQADGLLKESKVKSTLSGNMTMTGGVIGSMTVPITIKTNVWTKYLEPEKNRE